MVETRLFFWLAVAIATTTTLAFAPPLSQSKLIPQSKPAPLLAALEVVGDDGDDGDDDAKDPFDAYEPTPEQTTVVFRDDALGSGYTVGELPTQQLKIKYKATFLEPNPGAQFDFSDAFICKTGQNKILPGFEEGLQGMRVGGKRTIRVPPNKGYGDQWYKGTIPPNAHLQFECELLNIAQTPQEEFMEKLEKFGIGRAIGISVCLGYLAISPFLEKAGIV